jgi:hypothetical protein
MVGKVALTVLLAQLDLQELILHLDHISQQEPEAAGSLEV